MMWVWQSGRVNSWLAGCLAGGWLMWCCCLVVETASWCWFYAMSKCSVKISNGSSVSKMFTMSDLHLILMILTILCNFCTVCLLILLIFADFAGHLPWVSLWVQSGYDLWQVLWVLLETVPAKRTWIRLEMVVQHHKMFENQSVNQSSWQMKKNQIWPTQFKCFSLGICRILAPKWKFNLIQRFVTIFARYMNKFRGR